MTLPRPSLQFPEPACARVLAPPVSRQGAGGRLSFQTAPLPRVHWTACDTMSTKQGQSPAHWSKLAFVREEQL